MNATQTSAHTVDLTEIPPGGLDITRLDLGGDVVFVTDRDGTIVDVNDAFVRVTGYSREEALGSKPSLLSSGVQDDDFYADLWRTITSGQVWEGEMVDRRRDGTLRTHHVTITPVQAGDGQITHYVAVERDVTADLARQASGGPVGLAHTDPTGRCVFVDSQTARLLERTSADLLADGLLAALVEEDAQQLREVVGMAVEHGRDLRLDVRTASGRWLGVEVAPLTVASGNVIGARIALEDITARLVAERELELRDAYLTSVLDALDEPVAVVGGDGRVLTTNALWRRAAGDRPEGHPLAAQEGDDLLALARRSSAHADLAEDLGGVLRGFRRVSRHSTDVRITTLAWDEGGAVVRVLTDPDSDG